VTSFWSSFAAWLFPAARKDLETMCGKLADAVDLDSELHRATLELVEVFKRWADAKEGGLTCWTAVQFMRGLQTRILEE
jgi:hypothetical protein